MIHKPSTRRFIFQSKFNLAMNEVKRPHDRREYISGLKVEFLLCVLAPLGF